MKRKLLSLLLVVCMVLSLLPATAYAAVGDLLGNSPEENQALLAELENLTGQDGAAVRALLEQYGLLDEDGNLVTDQAIVLDGVEYTLEEIEAMLEAPDTDLSRKATVDGVPISLGDLQTIIAIERELQRIQEIYFSDRVFEGESLDNLNSLMGQLQAEGISLMSENASLLAESGSGTPIADVSGFESCAAGSTVSTTIAAKAGDTLSVKVTYVQGLAALDSVTVKLGNDSVALSSSTTSGTLSYTAAAGDDTVTLSVTASGATTTDPYVYGTLTGAVQFTNPEGFVFQNGGAYTDAHTVQVTAAVDMPDLDTTYTGHQEDTTQNNLVPFNDDVGIDLILNSDMITSMNELVTLLKETGEIKDTDPTVNYTISMTISQYNSKETDTPGNPYYSGGVPIGYMAMLGSDSDGTATSSVVAEPSGISTTFISKLEQDPDDISGNQTWGGNYWSYMWPFSQYDIDISVASPASINYQAPTKLSLMYIAVAEQVVNDPTLLDSLTISYYGQSVTLNNDNDNPTCTSTTALTSGTYRTGQRVPILLTFDELVKVNESGTVMNINNKNFTAADLWMSNTAGTSLLAWYPVQKGDGVQLSITSANGITDVFGNKVSLNTTVPDVTLEGLILRFAPTGLTASPYNEATGGVTFNVAVDSAFDNSIANYDNGETAPFRVVVQDGTETYNREVKIVTEGAASTLTTDPLIIPRKQENTDYTATLQVNMGTKEKPSWVDASWISTSFTVPAYVDVESVTVTADEPDVKELSLSESYWPTLTATLTGTGGKPPTATSGTWSSSDPDIATITAVEGNPLQAKVTPVGKKVGPVTFTFTADNGTDDADNVDTDDKTGTITYTVTAGDSLALNIPTNSATIVTRKNAAATVLWLSNADQFATDGEGNPVSFTFTVKLYEGCAETEAKLDEEKLLETYTVTSDKNSLEIPAGVLSQLSDGDTPAYTVRVSMPHPLVEDKTVELSALAWIVVYPVPAKAILTPPQNLYLKDAGTVNINWAVENRDDDATGQTVNLTILRVQEDNSSTQVCNESLEGSAGTYPLQLQPVAPGHLKDTYQVMLTVTNTGSDAPSTDSFPLYVYNGDALKLQNSAGEDLGDTLTMDNTSKVSGTLPEDTSKIMSLRETLSLIEYVNINYKGYNWNTYLDGIKWETSDSDMVSVNYKQGGLYENIDLFDNETYLPDTIMALSSTKDGKATITATHQKTGMSDTVTVDVTTLRDKFYLFQVSPAQETTLRYVDGNNEEQTATTNDQGVLALYEPNGIASDVWLSSGNVWQNDEYMGTIYRQNLQSGEQDATMLQLYPLNTTTLRQAAKVDLTLLKPDGSPLADTEVTLRGGVFKNGYYCETSGIGGSRSGMNGGGPDQTDVTVKTDDTGEITVYFDATQFWSAAAGENAGTPLLSTDQIQYVLEIRNIAGDAYYPVFQTVDASVSIEQEMHTASGVVVLETASEKNKPFVAHQIVDYGLDNGSVLDVRGSTGKAGPTKAYPEATLVTTMFLWGVDSADAQNCDLKITDENGYIPAGQTSTLSRYPFTTIPVVENTITLSAETMTASGWIPEGKDMGVKARLTSGGSLLREITLPFRVMDLTKIPEVTEDENVSQMLVTLTDSSKVNEASFGGTNNAIMKGLNGVLNDISGPIDTSVFKMIITPTNDPTVFNALIWGGKDKLGLEDMEYNEDGISFQSNYLEGEFDVSRPGRSDLSQMAQGTYIGNTIQENVKMTSRDMEFKYQLTGYYEAQIRYNLDNQKWELYTTGGGFTAGVGVGIGFTANTMVGPVPVTGSFGIGGAIQLDFKTAVRYSQQGNNIWSDPDATAVNDYLTNLRIVAYVNAFGGVGFDFSVIALKIGLYGELSFDSQNKFLSRTYLADSAARQLNGQHLQTTGEVGIKFVAKFLLISYETNLVSAGFSAGASFGQWDTIENYWNSATTGLSVASLRSMAAQNAMAVASASATLQSLDYLDTYARTWGQPQARMALYSLDASNGLDNLQSNANPNSYPEISDDGQVLVYVNDGYDHDKNPTPSIYDSRAHYSTLSGSSYSDSAAIADPGAGTADAFAGYGDSDVDIAGSSSFAAAAWVRMSSDLPGKDGGDPVTVEEQNLLMNGTEIVASVYTDDGWTSQRLTTNGTPDLAPAVASNGKDQAVVFWRSVYSSDPDNVLGFTSRDSILYSVYKNGSWSDAKTLYNGSNGSVKALEAAMLPDGTAIAVYTLDKSGAGETDPTKNYEVGYTIVKASDGAIGTTMLATSDSYLDENPQVVSASFGTGSDRFVIAWHSLRDGVSDIQMRAVDENGVMSNSFPASLSEITSDGSATVSASFRLAALNNSYRDVTNLTVIWDETVEDHSVLKAARLRSDGGTGYVLSAPMELATLGAHTMADHFEAYVSSENQVKAIIQATQYGGSLTEIDTDIPQTTLYTATSDFALDAVEVEAIVPDYENLALGSLMAVQFVIRNTGLNNVEGLTVTMDSGETATLDQSLLPNQSATLTVLHQIDNDAVKDASYTVTTDGGAIQSGTVYLDYPDIGISRMEVVKEEAGKRTISMTLYNASPATLAGNKDRTVKLAFYTDDLRTKAASGIESKTAGVAIDNTDKNILVISGEEALKRIDAGSFTLELTYDLGSYVKAQGLEEIPSNGVYLYADLWTEGKVGDQSGTQQLMEYSSSDNQKALPLSGALARTGQATTLNVDLSADSEGKTVATVTLKNNSMKTYTGTRLAASLLGANGELLETKLTTITDELPGETSSTSTVNFSQSGSRVVVTAYTPGTDILTFDGLPVSMDDFTPAEDGTLTCSISGISANGTLVTAVSGSGGKVSINGTESDDVGSLYVPIGIGETVITVNIGSNTYVLHITSAHSSSGGGGVSSYKITVESSDHGKVTADRSSSRAGATVTLTAVPEDGYRLASLTVTGKDGKTVTLNDKGDGSYTFTMPASAVTVKATFGEISSDTLPFVDVSLDSWYYDGAAYVYEKGLMNGTSATTFSPDMTTSRAMIATILWRLEGSPVVDYAMMFDDVDPVSWYGEAVRWAASEGIVNGYGNNQFGPNDPITREQMAAMLYRYAQYQEYDVSVGENANILSYTDADQLGTWAVSAMQWACGAGIINGTGDGSTLSPQGQATRAQAAVMLMRFCDGYVTW